MSDDIRDMLKAIVRLEIEAKRICAINAALLSAAQKVIAGLNARIDTAPRHAVPVFDGIAELHDAIAKAKERRHDRP